MAFISWSFLVISLVLHFPSAWAQDNGTFPLSACVGGPTVFVTVDGAGSTVGSSTGTAYPTATIASSPQININNTINITIGSTSSSSTTLDWQSCDWGQDANLQCATLLVPLDYTVSSSVQKRADGSTYNTMELPLFRVPATSSNPRNQSILFNPGGPGGSGVPFMYTPWRAWFKLFGNDFDLIGFDPRGINNTMPYYCQIPAANTAPIFWTESEEEIQDQLNDNTQNYDACVASNPDQGALVGTAFVARDIMQIVDALNEDGLLRYVGVSYGTLIGDTVAAMFPDRMDKLILDANVDPVDYYHGDYSNNFRDTDNALSGFFQGCANYPDLCGLDDAANMTGAQLEQQFLDYMNQATSENSSVNPVSVEQKLFRSLYIPDIYQSASASLQKIYSQISSELNGTTASNQRRDDHHPNHNHLHHRYPSLLKTPSWKRDLVNRSLVYQAIRCGDSRFGGQNTSASELSSILTNYAPYADKLYLETIAMASSCVQWPQRAKEVYSGDFQVQTKGGILFVNNPNDPITPIESAVTANGLFQGSVLLTHEGYGHSSLADYSTCTLGWYRSYMRNGTLPAAGTVCNANVPVFASNSVNAIYDDPALEELDDLVTAGQVLQAWWADYWSADFWE